MSLDDKLREILADAKTKRVDTFNSTTVAPDSKEIELTHTGDYKDGDIVSVQIGNFAGHPRYLASLQGYKLTVSKRIPYKIDVGTRISLASWPEVIEQIKQAFADEGYKREWSPDNTFATPRKVLAKLPKYHTNGGVSHIYSNVGAKQICMTGQEWYDRFKKELNYSVIDPRFTLNKDAQEYFESASEAAKRAAGLEETQANGNGIGF